MLEERAPRNRRRAMGFSQRCQPCCDTVEVSKDEPQCAMGHEHRRRVHHVLARRAPVHVGGPVVTYFLPQGAHERLDGVANRSALLQQTTEVVELGAAAIRDRGGSVRGHDSCRRFGPRERALDVEHGLEPRPTRDCVEKLLGDEERPERGHTRKNAVCSEPWRRMSKRSPASSCCATSVARSLSPSSERTGSAAFASSSSGK